MSASLSIPKHLSFQDLSTELQRKFRTAGGTWRNLEDAQKLYKQVPAAHRISIKRVAAWMKRRDGSHIVPKSAGGADEPFNIVLEKHLANVRRGAKPMTKAEQFSILVEGFSANLRQSALDGLQAAPTGAAIAVAARLPITFIHYSCAVARGEMTKEQAIKASGKDLSRIGATGAISTAAVVMLCTACPPIAAALACASPVLIGLSSAFLLKEYYSVIEENKDIISKVLRSKAKNIQEIEEAIQLARIAEVKEKFGFTFWFQWLGVTLIAGVTSCLGVATVLEGLESSLIGLYSLLAIALSVGFMHWMLITIRMNSGLKSLFIHVLAVSCATFLAAMLFSVNPWLSLAVFFGLAGAFTFRSVQRCSEPLFLTVSV